MSVVENSLVGVKLAIEASSNGWMFGYFPLIWNFLSHKRSTSLWGPVAGSMHKTLTLSTFVVEKDNIFLGLDEYTTMDFISVPF